VTSTYESLRKDFDEVHSAYETVVKEKDELKKTNLMKAHRFHEALLKKFAEIWRDTKASVSALGGRCAKFPTDASVSDFLEWFWAEVEAMPTTFAECNESTTCYVLIGILQMLAGEVCEHLLKLKELATSCDASLLQDFPKDIGKIAKRLVSHWWTK
jgi:hypothetical protein